MGGCKTLTDELYALSSYLSTVYINAPSHLSNLQNE